MRGGFNPFAALGMLSALVMAYLLGGAAIFAAAWLM